MNIALNQWESEFFHRDIYRVIFDNRVEKDQGKLDHYAQKGLLQAKVATSDLANIHFLQQNQFHLVETEIVFRLDIAKIEADQTACRCRIAVQKDIPALNNLVGVAFPNTRFRLPYFSQAENQRFYQTWIENAVWGNFDDFCTLIDENGKLQGVVSGRIEGGDIQSAKLGLLAVFPEYQGKGLGKRLLSCAILQAKSQQAERIEIATQLSNSGAIRLYQSFGAEMSQSYYWFYR